jgi:hypothetical protein
VSDGGFLQYSPPTGVSASQAIDLANITISWFSRPSADSYDLYRSTSISGTYTKIQSGIASLSATDTVGAASAGQSYYYKVTAHNSALAVTDTSNVADCIASGTGYVKFTPPAAVIASQGLSTGYVQVSGYGVSGANTYDIYRSDDSYSTKKDSTSSLTWNDASAIVGTDYKYKVVAKNTSQIGADNSSSLSGESGIGYKRLFAPTGVTATSGTSTSVSVSWSNSASNPPSVVDGYNVYRSDNPTTKLNLSPVVALSYSDSTALAGSIYTYTVVALNSLQVNAESVNSSASTSGYRDFDPPTGLSATLGSAGTGEFYEVNLSWTAPSGSTITYQIWRGLSAGSETFYDSTSATSYSDTGLANGGYSSPTKYYYIVKAWNSSLSNSMSVGSNEVNRTLSVVATPSVSVTNSSSNVSISWGAITGAVQYRIYRNGTEISGSPTSSLSVTDNPPVAGLNYTYAVAAERTGAGSHTGSVSAGVSGRENFGTFSNSPVLTGTVFTITWSNMKAQSYDLEYSTDSGGSWTSLGAQSSGCTYTATSGLTYRFRVNAISANETKYSTESSDIIVP